MNPCHYPQLQPRSRSPSPRRNRNSSQDSSLDPSLQKLRTASSVSNRSNVERSGMYVNTDTLGTSRPRVATRDGARINEFLNNSQPIDALVNVRSRTPTQSNVSREMLLRSGTDQSEIDPLAGTINNYGSTASSSRLIDEDMPSVDNLTRSEGGLPRSGSPRLKRQKSYFTPSMVDDLRKRNKLYFLDPITKLRNFHGFPWKLTLQIIKIVLITVQIIIFGGQRENIVDYFERSELAYKHLLLENWEPAFETLPYPPASGPYAIYTMDELFSHLNYAMEQYYNMSQISLAVVYVRDEDTQEVMPIQLCFKANRYRSSGNGTYIVAGNLLENCTFVKPLGEKGNYTFDVKRYLKSINFTLPYNRTLELELKMKVRTFHLNLLHTHYGPTCYHVHITISYINTQRSGQILIDLNSLPSEIDCRDKVLSPDAEGEMEDMKAKVIAYDAAVIAICCLSTILCSRSLKRCNRLRMDTARYFKLQRGRPFSLSNHMEYINMWYIIIICNDIFTVIGSCFKIQLESRIFSITSENYELCSIMLGIGVFLTYIGVLRYLTFFKSYNVLILTLKTSFPHVIRFLVCAICLYTGFLFCGWIVFSPYHIKFRTLSTASECLFSLVNGDDMFVTFSALSNNSTAIWFFHRAYLYIFISLFIYVVLSVFIAVIMDNYESLKHFYEKGFPDSEVQQFIQEAGDLTIVELFSHVGKAGRCQSWFFCIFPCMACLKSPFSSQQVKTNSVSRERQELLATI